METSEQLDKLYTALATAQGTIQSAKKDAINPFFKSQYATLDSIWNAIRSPLSTNELSVIQIPIKDQGGLKLITRLCHSSGQWVQGVFEIQPSKEDLQGIGSALTYARRYALAAMVGVTADEDDDGNNETATSTKQAKLNGNSNGDEPPAKPPHPDPSQWLPDLQEFSARAIEDFGIAWVELKVILKDECGFTGFKRENAGEMYNCLAKYFAHEDERHPIDIDDI